MKVRRLRVHKRGRIEIIPMIDVMFFLLATFILASLSMQNLHALGVTLPQGSTAPSDAKQPVTLAITEQGQALLNGNPVALEELAETIKPLLSGPESDVIVAADSAATQGVVVQAMLAARQAGAQNFQIAVKPN